MHLTWGNVHHAFEHGNLEIAFEEKTNAMMSEGGIQGLVQRRLQQAHLGERQVYIEARYEKSRVLYTIRDEGKGFDHASQIGKPIAAATALHGRGIMLIRHYMDAVDWNDAGNEVQMSRTFQIKGTEPESE